MKQFHWKLKSMDIKAHIERETKVFEPADVKGGINSSNYLIYNEQNL